MKVVVAGGSGFIGRHLVRALVAENHEVVVLSREPRQAVGRLPAGATVIEWGPTAADLGWAEELANAAAVMNLCRGHVGPINALVDAIASLPLPDRPRSVIQASSVEVYPDTDLEVATEETPPALSPLAQQWVDGESAALAAERLALRVVLLRLGLVIARDAPARSRLALPVRLLLGVSWVGIDDAVGLIVRAIAGWDICGPLNVTAPGQRVTPAKAMAASYEFVQPTLAGALVASSLQRPLSATG